MDKVNNFILANRDRLTLFWSGTALIFLPVMIWVFWLAVESGGMTDVVAFDHALAARNVVEGKGLSSPVVTPLHISVTGELDNAAPIFAKPLFTLWEAVIFRLRSVSMKGAGVASGIPWIVTVWLVFYLSNRMYGRGTAWLCFTIFLFNTQGLDLSVSGRPETMGMLLVCALFALILSAPPNALSKSPPMNVCLLSGVVIGLLWLTMPHIVMPLCLVFAIYWYVWPLRASMEKPVYLEGSIYQSLISVLAWATRSFRMRTLATFFMGVLLPVVLLFVFRLVIPGKSPESLGKYLTLIDSAVAPGWSYWRTCFSYDPSLPLGIMSHPNVMFAKALNGITYGFKGFVSIVHPVLFALYGYVLIFPEYGEKHKFRWMLIALVLMHIAGMSFFYWDVLYLSIWIPMIIIIGVGVFERLFEHRLFHRVRAEKHGSVWIQLNRELFSYYMPIIILLALTVSPFFLRIRDGHRTPKIFPGTIVEYLMQQETAFATIATPSPWMVSWFTGSRTVWLPETLRAMKQLDESHGDDIDAICFPRRRVDILHDKVPAWWYFAMRREKTLPPAYTLEESTAWGEVLYVRKPAEYDVK